MVSLAPSSIVEHGRIPRIEILGVFGSGKSTLAAKLATTSTLQHLPEDHSKNLSWGRAEAIERAGHLPYDLSFMIQYAYLAADGLREGATTVICDWSFATDRLWASMRLGHDSQIYDAVQDAILDRVAAAHGYLYLKQSINLIIERISVRDRAPESVFNRFVEKAVLAVDSLADQIPEHQLQVVVDDDTELALGKKDNSLSKESR